MFKKDKFEYAALILVLGLAYFIAFIPHRANPYPVHLDEWQHVIWAQTLVKNQSTTFTNVLTGSATQELGTDLYVGYHLFLGTINEVTGISWIDLVRYFPSIIFMLTVLGIYCLGRREGFGLPSALMTCLLPTTTGLLGPAFLVPLALGMLFFPIILFLAFNVKGIIASFLIGMFIAFLVIVHAPSAVFVSFILVPYAIINLRTQPKHALGILLAVVGGFTITLPWTYVVAAQYFTLIWKKTALPYYVQLPNLRATYGYVAGGLALFGIFLTMMTNNAKRYSLVIGLALILILLTLKFVFGYGLEILYYRGVLYTMLIMGIMAGFGLMWLGKLRLPESFTSKLKVPLQLRRIGLLAGIALIALVFLQAMPNRLQTNYYHMIDTTDYNAFIWIRENLGSQYENILLDPWKGTAFMAITGKSVFTFYGAVPHTIDLNVYSFLAEGCQNTAFLQDHDISVIYTRDGCDNPDLVEVRQYVYVLRGDVPSNLTNMAGIAQ